MKDVHNCIRPLVNLFLDTEHVCAVCQVGIAAGSHHDDLISLLDHLLRDVEAEAGSEGLTG